MRGVGGVAGIEFVAASDPIDCRMLDNRVIDRTRVIACNSEDFVHTNLVKTPQDILNDSFVHDRVCFLL
jgi:hypothetical protein